MISLSSYLRNHGYDPEIDQHTRIPGIWSKLRTLYNLDIIDERENSFEYEDVEDKYLEFRLPEEEYDEELFMRGKRGPSEAPSSPPRMGRSPSPQGARKRKRADTVTNKNRASTVEDTDDPKTSPANSPPPKATRAGRNTNRSIGRTKADSSSRAPSKDTALEDDEAAEETEEVAEEEEDEGEEEDGTPSPKTSKGKAKADAPTTRKSKRKR
jgi:MRG-binding protein